MDRAEVTQFVEVEMQGGGGGAISFVVGGNFILESNLTISKRWIEESHYDGSGAGGSVVQSVLRLSITNFGSIHAKGGDALGDSTLAGAGGGGRIALLSDGAISEEGDVNASGGQNFSLIHSTYRQGNLVWSDLLDYGWYCLFQCCCECSRKFGFKRKYQFREKLAGKKGGAFISDGDDDMITIPYNNALVIDEYTVSKCGIFRRGIMRLGPVFLVEELEGLMGRIHSIWQGDSSHGTDLIYIIVSAGTNWKEGEFCTISMEKNGIILFSLTRG